LIDIAAVCGFSDQSHFGRVFKRTFGLTPGAWRRSPRPLKLPGRFACSLPLDQSTTLWATPW
jgi:AraC-like DNA-binding protein